MQEATQRGFVLWFTGLSGAGKSTLSVRLYEELRRRGARVELLDGDEVRTHLSAGLSFSKADRNTNVRRIGWVCRLLARNGVIAISAAISPYREVRDELRALTEADGAAFVEVFASCDIQTLAERDVKGLYKKALAGEIPHFTGVSDPYEEPLAPEVVTDSARETPDESCAKILRYLEEQSLIS
jgi:adenylyl-sulfate kinase